VIQSYIIYPVIVAIPELGTSAGVSQDERELGDMRMKITVFHLMCDVVHPLFFREIVQ